MHMMKWFCPHLNIQILDDYQILVEQVRTNWTTYIKGLLKENKHLTQKLDDESYFTNVYWKNTINGNAVRN